jgi:CubicO group peptidase (beta-lactamase class C family)
VDVDAIKKEFDAKRTEATVKVVKAEKTVGVKAEKNVKEEKPAKAKAPKAKKICRINILTNQICLKF